MYQFNTMFSEISPTATKKTYRWHGLAAGLGLGWLPAWALLHFSTAPGWSFPLVWLGAPLLGYYAGKLIPRSRRLAERSPE